MINKRVLQLAFASLVLIASIIINGTSGASLQYGDKCMMGENSTDLMCNAKESLTCQNGTCLCSDMTKMTYDPTLGLCVGLAGHDCVNHPTEARLPNFRKTHCVSYASCEDRKCTCWSAFFMDESAHCSRKRGYLQQCRMDYQCDGRQGFLCKDGLCVCDKNVAAYNPELERCVGLANEPCVNQYRECVENYKCKVGECQCKYKEVPGPDGKMICDPVAHNYGKSCGRARGTCGADLLCINGKCRCSNPDYQVYDYEQRICVSLVGGPCTVPTPASPTQYLDESSLGDDGRKNIPPGLRKKNDKNNSKIKNKKKVGTGYSNSTVSDNEEEANSGSKVIPCLPYARCLPYGDPNRNAYGIPEMGRCECDRGFIETKKGKCNLPYNAPCDTHSKNKKDMCDETVPLYCVNNACSCKNTLDIYEDESKACKKSIGNLCWKDPSCTSTARCIRYSPRLPGRCMCPPNSHPDANSANCISTYQSNFEVDPGYDEEDDVSKEE